MEGEILARSNNKQGARLSVGRRKDFILATLRLYMAITIAEAIKKLLITGLHPCGPKQEWD